VGAVSVVAPLEPLIVSIREAGKALSVSPAQMYVLVKKGHFKLVKIPGAGKRSGILVSDLKKYIAQCVAAAPAPIAATSAEPRSSGNPRTEADQRAIASAS